MAKVKTWAYYLKREKWMKDNGVEEYTKRIELPKSEWYTCPSCDGKSSYYMEGDLHKSGGIVPCGCGDGIRRYRLETRYRVRVNNAKR